MKWTVIVVENDRDGGWFSRVNVAEYPKNEEKRAQAHAKKIQAALDFKPKKPAKKIGVKEGTMSLLEKIRCRAIWKDERGLRVVSSTMDQATFRWIGRNQAQGSGRLVEFPSAISGTGERRYVHVHTMPLGPSSRCMSFKLKTFLRRFKPTGRKHRGSW